MAENREHGKGAIGSPHTLQPTSAFSRFRSFTGPILYGSKGFETGPADWALTLKRPLLGAARHRQEPLRDQAT